MKITTEQVLRIHKCTSINNQEELKQWFPEVFSLKVGTWYRHRRDYAFQFNGTFGNYTHSGFGEDEIWVNDEIGVHIDREYIEMSSEEISNVLKKEALRRGYNNDNYKSLSGCYTSEHSDNYTYDHSNQALYSGTIDNKCNIIYKDGVWAEIVEPVIESKVESKVEPKEVTMEQLEAVFGCKVKIVA